jgi:predicted mannosyl-3-phosphoglycerate phosphatase (HAD superfamily)
VERVLLMKLSLHLVSDLDGTWLPPSGDSKALRELEAFVASEPGIVLTFATGRTLESALSALNGLAKVWPRHLVTDVGTTIYHHGGSGNWEKDASYARWVDARWDQVAAETLAPRLLPPGVRLQPKVRGRRRVALETQPGRDLPGAAEDLARNLEQAGFNADVLASNDRCLDVLPKGVHKGSAVEYLQERSRLPRPLVVCGNSENDLGMLRVADIAVLMADSSLRSDRLGVPPGHVIRSSSPGPGGILEVLLALTSPAARGERRGAR